ncbi:GNAT family N-acetyltransferase [candidate division FCPU426 bacterium]|nr:GNAT family N-acetyltransferase [candidate division FCPU426 bacterium]
MPVFLPVSGLADIEKLRAAYLDGLRQPQELYVEKKVRSGSCYLIQASDENMGYAVLGQDSMLLEYYLLDQHIPQGEHYFEQLLRQLDVRLAWCKSFDHLFLKYCLRFSNRPRVHGTLFRDVIERPLPSFELEINTRPVEETDATLIKACREGMYESEEEVDEDVSNKRLLVFSSGSETIGWGSFQRVLAERPDFDIGLLVHPDHRRKGYGTYIAIFMRRYCYQNNWRPICGCKRENTASRRTLEKAGFVSKYDLIEFPLSL